LGKERMKRVVCLLIVIGLLFGSGIVNKTLAAEKKIRVVTDPRIELLTVVQCMVGYWPMSQYDTTYLNEVYEKFGEFYMHPVLRLYAKMWFVFGFDYDIPYALMLHLSEPLELQIRTPIPKYILERMGGEKNLNDFLDLLRDYAKQTKFMDFYEDHRLFYKTHTDAVTELIAEKDYIRNLEDFFGPNQNSYSIILSPLVYEEGYGVKVGNTMYSIIGPSRSEEGEPVFTDPEKLAEQVYHEFSQSFIGPLTAQNREEILRYEKLYTPIMEEMMYSGYPTWELCYNEHLIRSVMNHILQHDLLAEEIEKKKNDDYFKGFVYSEVIFELFQDYLNHRDLYPNFTDFYPNILDTMQHLCELPYTPAYLEVVYASTNGVQLSWKDNSKDEKGFKVYRMAEGETEYTPMEDVLEPDITYFRDNTIQMGKTYQYKIAAIGLFGEITTNHVVVKIPVTKPVSVKKITVSVDLDLKQLTFKWEYPFTVDGFQIYEVTGERMQLITLEGDQRSATIEKLEPGLHIYVITAFYQDGKTKLESIDSTRIKVEVQPEE